MKLISCEKLEKSMAELQFSIDAETFKSAVNAAFKREGKKYAIPGFRKGKAPKAMIEKMYGKDLFQYDAINDLFPENYEAAVKEANIDVVGRPDAEVVSMSEEEGATLKVKVAVKPEVELGEYAGLTVNKDVKTVDEADVDAEIKRMQDRNGRLLTREGAAENGDTVDIDFEGFVDGVAFDGGKAEHYSLVLGSGSFIPGFEEQIVGHAAGEEFDVNVKFPEEYQAEELAGKDATFKIKLHEVQYKELPELDDDFAKDVSEYDTLDELKDSIRKGSILVLSLLLRLDHSQYITLLPKSVTTAISMDVSKELGGIAALTGAIVILTGILGALMAEMVCKVCHITHPIARGIGIGTAAHAVGTSKALQMGEVEGAMSGLAVAVAGVMTAILCPVFSSFIS